MAIGIGLLIDLALAGERKKSLHLPDRLAAGSAKTRNLVQEHLPGRTASDSITRKPVVLYST